MPISSLTLERKEELVRDCEAREAELERLHAQSIQDMWMEDLAIFEKAYTVYLKARAAEDHEDASETVGSSKARKPRAKKV
jgi:hypothetical protein